jgi:TRAP-type C4-dicarboxylate transport system substrate-binding protein
MKGWKKFACIFALVSAVLILAACGGNGGASSETSGADTATSGDESGSSAEDTATSEFANAPTFELKASHPQPAGSSTDVGYEKLAELVEEYTDGTIKITVYPAASLVSMAENVQAVQNGTVEIGQMTSGDLATMAPILSVCEIPAALSGEWADETKPIYNEILEPLGLHVLHLQAGTDPTLRGAAFLSNTVLVKTPDDLKGLKVRASGQQAGKAVELWGGTPVTLTFADLAPAMERNTVDVVMTPLPGAFANSWYELEHYISSTPFIPLMAFMTINKDIYDSMTPAQQEAISKAAKEACLHMDALSYDEIIEGLDVMEEYGNEIYIMTEEEAAAFSDILEPLYDEIIEQNGDLAKRLVDAYKKYSGK